MILAFTVMRFPGCYRFPLIILANAMVLAFTVVLCASCLRLPLFVMALSV
jgi:hypothetical protein